MGSKGRGGATDSATKGIKRHTNGHSSSGASFKQRYYTATLGWFNFDPDEGSGIYRNTIRKTMFHDDLDHMGSIAIANDLSNVDNSFGVNGYKLNRTRHADNVMYYSVYSRLRKAGYFSEEVKAELRANKSKYEYRVFQQEDGSWAFREMKYVYNRVYDMLDKNYVTGTGNNPFGSQTPFIRIEQRYSTLGEDEILVMAIDETKEVNQIKGNNKSITTVDLSNRYAMKIKVYGNGDATGGVMISLTSPTASEKGRTDYYIPPSHTGWREFILIDADNADHPGSDFSNLSYTWNVYETYRANPDRKQINTVHIGVAGNVSGVKIDDLRACKAVDTPVKNPSVTIGGSTITFECEIHSTEFIEFYPETGKAYLNYYTDFYKEDGVTHDYYEAHTKEISYTGSVTAPSGSFEYTYNAEALTDASPRAEVTLGFSGGIVANPADWVAPEVDMGKASLDIKIR